MLVIGGGGAGYAAASTVAKLGRRVAMVEGGQLGGTCLNRGCVPTKTLIRSARVLETIRRADRLGIQVGAVRLDYPAVQGYPTMPELVRWTADQVGKHLEAGEQVRRAEGGPLHPGPIGLWLEQGAAARAREHLAAVG